MTLQTAQQWLSLIALLIGIINALWIWLSRPARDTNKRIDEANREIAEVLEGMKGHDRRIQRVEDDLRHLPTKEDLSQVSHKLTAVKTELDIVARTVTRIDEFLRKHP